MRDSHIHYMYDLPTMQRLIVKYPDFVTKATCLYNIVKYRATGEVICYLSKIVSREILEMRHIEDGKTVAILLLEDKRYDTFMHLIQECGLTINIEIICEAIKNHLPHQNMEELLSYLEARSPLEIEFAIYYIERNRSELLEYDYCDLLCKHRRGYDMEKMDGPQELLNVLIRNVSDLNVVKHIVALSSWFMWHNISDTTMVYEAVRYGAPDEVVSYLAKYATSEILHWRHVEDNKTVAILLLNNGRYDLLLDLVCNCNLLIDAEVICGLMSYNISFERLDKIFQYAKLSSRDIDCALHYAADNVHNTIIKQYIPFLVEHGASLTAKNSDDQTAYEVVTEIFETYALILGGENYLYASENQYILDILGCK